MLFSGLGEKMIHENKNYATVPFSSGNVWRKKCMNHLKKIRKYPVTDDMQEQSRRFSLDLTPRLLYARGEMVELLISSNIARQIPYSHKVHIYHSVCPSSELGPPTHPLSRKRVYQNGTEYNSVVNPDTHGSSLILEKKNPSFFSILWICCRRTAAWQCRRPDREVR